MKRILIALGLLCASYGLAHAADSAIVVSACGTPPTTYTAGQSFAITQDTTGKLCDTGGGGGGGSLSAKATASDPSYVEGSSDPLSMNLSGYLRSHIDPAQVYTTGTASAIPSANLAVDTLPVNASGDPYTEATLNITSATTTTIVSGTAAQTVRVYAIVLTCAAAQTIDIQSTGGTSRTGGALTCASSGSIVLDPFATGSARYTSVSGEGIQFVTSTSGTIHGTVYYIKS